MEKRPKAPILNCTLPNTPFREVMQRQAAHYEQTTGTKLQVPCGNPACTGLITPGLTSTVEIDGKLYHLEKDRHCAPKQ